MRTLLTRRRDVCGRLFAVRGLQGRALDGRAVSLGMWAQVASVRDRHSRGDPAGSRMRRWARLLLVSAARLHGTDHLRYLLSWPSQEARGNPPGRRETLGLPYLFRLCMPASSSRALATPGMAPDGLSEGWDLRWQRIGVVGLVVCHGRKADVTDAGRNLERGRRQAGRRRVEGR